MIWKKNMEEIKAKLDDICILFIDDEDAKQAISDLLEVNRLLVAKLEQTPDWVIEYQCCPPGYTCCNCD